MHKALKFSLWGEAMYLWGEAMRLQVIPWGKAMENYYLGYKSLQVVLSLYPTLFSLDDKNCGRHRQGEKIAQDRGS